jgi:hypothetical protein
MKLEVLEGLPVEKVGVWNKVWAKQVLMSSDAEEKWKIVSREKRTERGDNGIDGGEEEEEDRKMGIKDDVEMRNGNSHAGGGGGGYDSADEEAEVGSMYEE